MEQFYSIVRSEGVVLVVFHGWKSFFFFFLFILNRVTKVKLVLLVLLVLQVLLVPEAPLETREKMGHVAPLENP